MDEAPEIELQTTLSKEVKLINFLKDNCKNNNKKLLKLAEQVWKDQPEFLQKGILTALLRAKNPVKYLERCETRVNDFIVMVEELIEQGFHGMMADGDVIHPILIKTNARWLKQGDQWSPDQEGEIMDEWVKAYMNENGLDDWGGRITLFKQFGFSGITKFVSIHRVPDGGKE